MKKRKILGIDYGDFTIGLAIFDLETDFIYPYKTIFRAKANVLRKSIREIAEIVKTENITDIVIGLPLNADGSEGDRVEKVKSFAHMLSNGLINFGLATKSVGDDILSSHVGANANIVGSKADIVGANACGALCTGELYEPNILIAFQDERLTTVEAKSILQERGIPKTEWKKNIDQIAAEIILQDYRQVKSYIRKVIYTIETIDISSFNNFADEIIIPNDYAINRHLEEIQIANLLKKEIGGVIELLKESNVDGEKMADYLWNNILWELKNISTKSSIDWQVRKAIKQIWKNPGGIILNLKNCAVNEDDIIDIVCDRIGRVAKKINGISIILVRDLKIIKYIKIKK